MILVLFHNYACINVEMCLWNMHFNIEMKNLNEKFNSIFRGIYSFEILNKFSMNIFVTKNLHYFQSYEIPLQLVYFYLFLDIVSKKNIYLRSFKYLLNYIILFRKLI